MASLNEKNQEARIKELERQVNFLTTMWYKENFSDNKRFNKRLTLAQGLELTNGTAIIAGTGTGLYIGSTPTEKIGFFGVTPVVQQGAISAPSSPSATYVQAEAQSAVNAILSIRSRLSSYGLIS